MITNAQHLVDTIRNHGHNAMYSLLDNIIYVESVYTYHDARDIVCVESEWEVIEATKAQVRAWLGY